MKLPALLALCALTGASAQSVKKEAPTEWVGQYSPETSPRTQVIKSKDAWLKLWEALGQPAPKADFSRYFAAVVFLGQQNSGGYGVKFLTPAEDKDLLLLRVPWRRTTPKGMVIEALTQPYAIKLYPKTVLPVRLEEEKTR